jgi:methionyl aminopeptidase
MVAVKKVDLAGLQRANRATNQLLRELTKLARPGVTTRALDDHAQAFLAALGAEPVFHTEAGFPAAINTSVNDVVVHGVPGPYALRDGDLLSIDAGLRLDGYCGDAAVTVPVGTVDPERRRLMETAKGAMRAGIAAAVTGNRVGDVSHAMQSYAEARGYGVVRGFVGHGLGRRMHEEPIVPFAGEAGTGDLLLEGLVITVEPAITEGSPEWRTEPDGWTIRTVDGGWAAQFEHAVVVGRRGAKILGVA